jgi:hypothetical protein
VQGSARNGGVFRSIEAIGKIETLPPLTTRSSCFVRDQQPFRQPLGAYVSHNNLAQLTDRGINFGLGLLAIPFTLWVVQSVPLYREDAKNAPSVIQNREGEEERP